MMEIVRRRWGDAFAIVIGGLTGLIMFPVVAESVHWIRSWYDQENPPVSAQLVLAQRVPPDALRLQFMVTRHRDCDFVRMIGMTGTSESTMQLATTMRREDGSDPISYPAGVTALSRPWILSPVYGRKLMLWGYYDCDNRIVRTRMIDTEIAQ